MSRPHAATSPKSRQANPAAHNPTAASQGEPGGSESSTTNNHYTIYGGRGGDGGPSGARALGQGGSGGMGEGNTLHQHFARVQNVMTLSVGQRRENEEGEERARLIDWLSPINFFLRQEEIFRTRQENTGGWILEDPLFKKWETSSNDEILWCTGMPGVGKTVLASIVVDYLRAKGNGGNSAAACLYLNHKELQTQTLENLFAGLWRQLVVKKPIPGGSLVRKLYKDYLDMGTRPRTSDIYDALRSVVAQCSRVYLVIDALDEYPERERRDLLKHIAVLGPTVGLIFTSRPNIHPGSLLSSGRKYIHLEVRGSSQDIRVYLAQQILDFPRLSLYVKKSPELQDKIITKIELAADGMFLLAKLHIESLSAAHNIHVIKTALENLPKKLEDAYADTMHRINRLVEADRKLALATLTWVTKARRLLTVTELQDALAIELDSTVLNPDNRTDIDIILGVCAGLVVVETNTPIIRIVHFTTQEYLDSHFSQGHTDITRLLLTYLAFNNLGTPYETPDSSGARAFYDLERAPLIAYAGYFLDHAELAKQDMETDVNSLRDIIISFLGQPYLFTPLRWYARKVHGRNPWFFRDWPTSASALWVAASANLLEIATYLLALGASPNSDGFEYVSALGIASYYGHIDMVELLIKAGARPNAAGVDPLQLACDGHHVDIVRILIKEKFNVDAAGGRYPSPLESVAPAGWSWRTGHPEIAQLLRDAGAHRRETGRNGLQIALENEQVGMVCYLLKDSDHDKVGTTLEAAVRSGHINVAKMLLEKVADLDAVRRSRASRTALEAASTGGRIDMTRMALEKFADLDAVDDYSDALAGALDAALTQDHVDMARMVLEKFADLHAVEDYSDALTGALETALTRDHVDMARMVLDKVADLDAVNHYSDGLRAALKAASTRGHINIARMALEKFADLDAVDDYSDELTGALEAALTRDHVDMARMVLEKFADLDAVDDYSDVLTGVLEAALTREHVDMARMVLDKVADLDAVDHYSDVLRAALQAAVEMGHINVANMLLEKVADLDAVRRNRAFKAAFEATLTRDHVDMAEMLLEKIANLHAVKDYSDALTGALEAALTRDHVDMARMVLEKFDALRAALKATVEMGHINVAKMLLEKVADLDAVRRSRAFKAALEAASTGGRIDMARMVLDKIADLDAVDDYSDALTGALEAASTRGHIDMARMVLDEIADLDAVDHYSDALRAALKAASTRGHINIARMVLEQFADLDAADDYSDALTGALEAASTRDHLDMARMVLEKIADLDALKHHSDALMAVLEAASTGAYIDMARHPEKRFHYIATGQLLAAYVASIAFRGLPVAAGSPS
ncbi:ankyrin repeat-containing domain protein [Mycena sanguinolenta]|nr:ankyrin repeat-containing domain protein [Mycena sanguinolenta]